MLSVDKINFRGYKNENYSKKNSSNVSFGINLTQAQKSEAVDKLFTISSDEVAKRFDSSLLPKVNSNTLAPIKKVTEFLNKIAENLATQKADLSESVADALNLPANDIERMFVDSQFKRIIVPVEKNDNFDSFLEKLFGGLYKKEEVIQTQENIVEKAIEPKIVREKSKKQNISAQSINQEEVQNPELKVSKKAAHFKKIQGLKDNDAKVTVSKIGSLKLEVQKMGHEIKTYQNELEKINAEITRLQEQKTKLTSKSSFYKNEIKRRKLQREINLQSGLIQKMKPQTASARLENIESQDLQLLDRRQKNKYQRYLMISQQQNNDQQKEAIIDLKTKYIKFNRTNPSFKTLADTKASYERILNFDEYYDNAVNNILKSNADSLQRQNIIPLKQRLYTLEKENELLIPYYQNLVKIENNGNSSYKIQIIDYNTKIEQLNAVEPKIQDYKKNDPKYNKKLLTWENKQSKLLRDKEKAEQYANNQSEISEIRAKLSSENSEEGVDVTDSQHPLISNLNAQKEKINSFLNKVNPKTGLSGREYLTLEVEKIDLRISEMSKELTPINSLISSISNLENKKQNLIDKINGTKKRQNEAKHERMRLEKLAGKKTVEKYSHLEVSEKAAETKANDLETTEITEPTKKIKKRNRTTKRNANAQQMQKPVSKKDKEYKPSPEQQARLEELKSELSPRELESRNLIAEKNAILLQINGETNIKVGQDAINNHKGFSEKIEKINAATIDNPDKRQELMNNLLISYREKQAEIHPKGLTEQIEELEQRLETASAEDKIAIEENIAKLERKISLLFKKIENIDKKLGTLAEITVPLNKEANAIKSGLTS